MHLPAGISASAARLPQTYEAAKAALAECSAIDECKEWADKAAALASYAKQADDDQLEKMAMRIRARAIRRAGEILKQIEPATGLHNSPTTKEAGNHPLCSRADVAREAGMSPHQQKTAIRVASIPAPDFDRQVESDAPPTLTKLASQGIQRRDPPPPDPQQWLRGRDPKAFNKALHLTGDITLYAEAIGKWDLAVLEFLDDRQRAEIRAALQKIDAIHDQIATRI